MVVVDVLELEVLHRVDLDGEDVVGGVVEVGGVEQTEVLAGEDAAVEGGARDGEGQAVPAELGVLGDDGEGEGGGERVDVAAAAGFETEWSGVEGVADEAAGMIGESEDAVGLDLGDAVEGQRGCVGCWVEASEEDAVLLGDGQRWCVEECGEQEWKQYRHYRSKSGELELGRGVGWG